MILIYFLLYIIIALSMVFMQPFGNPPDEYNRYLIPEYIAKYGTLPNGYEEEIRIEGYGFSYAFQPILPYMLQGFAMRAVSVFCDSHEVLLYTGRLVNFTLGLLMALFVLLLSRKWFSDKRLAWLFSFLVTFLPQSLFLHTYVNTDSCCMLSIAILLYGLTRGIEDRFSPSSCVLMSVGIILCALSYYNAYGYILSCILLFTAFFLSKKDQRLCFDVKPFLKYGIFISVLVLLGIGWWFLRSYLLYDGDFLGMRSRDICAMIYADPKFDPETRITCQNQGISVWQMLLYSDFVNLSVLSFIGMYGAMSIVTSVWVYRFYKLLFAAGIFLAIIFSVLPQDRDAGENQGFLPRLSRIRPAYTVFFHWNMIFCIAMPCILSVYYSYTADYQPQGRYLLPGLIPLAYYCVNGLYSGILALKKPVKKISSGHLLTGLCTVLCILIVISLLVTVYGYAYPYYLANPVAP
ncbi:MAG: DUF2142 domain-containing protein [Lachnospiraceae bacterium]|nr:DUF2142 domain-containing protein [Lachnospiraceae bacterium]